jgi:hypothetical protein
LIPNPIRKVLSSIQSQRVQALLMGGQACVFYGAAEFSRDTDLAILAEAANLERLDAALAELDAEVIAVPPFKTDFLLRGHAVHFRCRHRDASGMRVDVMAKMRNVDEFPLLWERRTEIALPDGFTVAMLGIEDLVAAKKTQRDKDWPMIRRLVEAHYLEHRSNPSRAAIGFWFRELRTAELLVEAAVRHPESLRDAIGARPLLVHAASANLDALFVGLRDEEDRERALDRAYWKPLRAELERLRHGAELG